jgi:hypothetical protein
VFSIVVVLNIVVKVNFVFILYRNHVKYVPCVHMYVCMHVCVYTMFPHCDIYKYTLTSFVGKAHGQVYHVLIDRRWHSSVLQPLTGAECDTDHCLVVTEFREMGSEQRSCTEDWCGEIQSQEFN